MKAILSHEAFVRAWQTSASLDIFCAATGYTVASATNCASRFRDKGVPLKRMPKAIEVKTPAEPGYQALAELAKSLSPS